MTDRQTTEQPELTDEEAAWIHQDRMDQEGKEELHMEEQAREEAQDESRNA